MAKQCLCLALYPTPKFNKPLGLTLLSLLLATCLPHTQLQGRGPEGPPPKSLIYSVKPDKVNNLDQFGESIVTMCKGIPTYMAEEIQGEELLYCTFQVSAGGIVRLFSGLSTEDTNYSGGGDQG